MPPVRGGGGGSVAGTFRFGIVIGGTLFLEAPDEVEEEAGANRRESENRAVLFARGKGALTVLFLGGPEALGGPCAEDMAPGGGKRGLVD